MGEGAVSSMAVPRVDEPLDRGAPRSEGRRDGRAVSIFCGSKRETELPSRQPSCPGHLLSLGSLGEKSVRAEELVALGGGIGLTRPPCTQRCPLRVGGVSKRPRTQSSIRGWD